MSQIGPVQCREKDKQHNPCYLQKFHATISYQNNATSQLNEYIKKLTLFSANIFDQRLFCCYEKHFQPVHEKVINMVKRNFFHTPT